MQQDRLRWDVEPVLEPLYEADEVLHLILSEGPAISIPDETDGDRVLIVECTTLTHNVSTW